MLREREVAGLLHFLFENSFAFKIGFLIFQERLQEQTVFVSILDKGAPYAAPPRAKKKRRKPDAKAIEGCISKWCWGEEGGPTCDGLDGEGNFICPGLIKCLRKAGLSKRGADKETLRCYAG